MQKMIWKKNSTTLLWNTPQVRIEVLIISVGGTLRAVINKIRPDKMLDEKTILRYIT